MCVLVNFSKWGFFIKVAEPLCFGLLGAVFITKKIKITRATLRQFWL